MFKLREPHAAVVRPLLLFLLLVPLSGCLALGTRCCDTWTFEAEDAAFFDALAGAPGLEETRHEGLGLRDARLDDAWGEYALVGIGRGNVSLTGTTPHRVTVSTGAPADVPPEALRAEIVAFLRETLDADEDAVQDAADLVLSNATAPPESGMPHEAGTTPPAPVAQAPTYFHSMATLPHGARAQALFEEATRERAWTPEVSYGRADGRVEAGDWVFGFAFPLRMLEVVEGEDSLRLYANGHGGVLGHARFADATKESDARAGIERLLAARGVVVEASGWRLQGSGSGAAPPPGSLPTPTP